MTYEQIQNYPVGTIYNREEYERVIGGFWYTEADKQLILSDFSLFNVKFNLSDNTYLATTKIVVENKIDGWLFNGNEWHCVELTWDGYQRIDDEEILKSKE